jgi:hypothetical protein
VQRQQHLQPLSHSELNCLRGISQCGDISPQTYIDPELLRLIELRLIEKVSLVWLPLEMQRDHYELTPLGHQMISNCDQDG